MLHPRVCFLFVLLVSFGAVFLAGPAAAQSFFVDKTWTGEADGDQFGIEVAYPGDLSGDGIADLVIAATTNDEGGNAAGKIYVYRGGLGHEGPPWVTAVGDSGDFLGVSMDGAGDVNGDGYLDLIVGAHRSSAGGADSGKAVIFFGGPEMDGVPDLTIVGPEGSRLGTSVAGVGDQNGDGYDDFLVGVPRAGDGGEAWLFLGGDPPDAVPDLILRGSGGGERFGEAVAGLPDINGDAAADFLVGAPWNSERETWSGKVYVYFGGAALDTIPDLNLYGEAAGDEFGSALSRLGDADGDGGEDFLVGAPYANAPLVDSGKAYVFFGGAALDSVADLVTAGENESDRFGMALAPGGDLNEDGFADWLAGAPGADTGGTEAGRVFVFYGGAFPDSLPDAVMDGEAGDELGSALAGDGDTDTDGRDDFLAGAWGVGPGKAVLYEPAPVTGVPGDGGAWRSALLSVRAHPNPFRGSAVLRVTRAGAGPVSASVHDLSGRLVRRLSTSAGEGAAGAATLTWNGADASGRRVPPGVYFVRVRSGNEIASCRVVVQ